MCKYYRLTSGLLLAIIILLNNSIGIQNMSSQRCYIKTRRTDSHVTSEAYIWGGEDHGDATGIKVSVFREPHALGSSIALPSRESRYRLMVKLCNQGIMPVTQVNGLVLCFPNGNGGIEMISDCA